MYTNALHMDTFVVIWSKVACLRMKENLNEEMGTTIAGGGGGRHGLSWIIL